MQKETPNKLPSILPPPELGAVLTSTCLSALRLMILLAATLAVANCGEDTYREDLPGIQDDGVDLDDNGVPIPNTGPSPDDPLDDAETYALIEEAIRAACRGTFEDMAALMDLVGIDSQDSRGFTVLICAANYGYYERAVYAFEMGANPNLQDIEGLAAIHHATLFEEFEVAELIISRKADLDLRDEIDATALWYMSLFGDERYSRLLLEAGANPEIPDDYRFTPLMAAAYNGHIEVVRLLLEYEARLEPEDAFGMTALDYAEEAGEEEIAELLRDHDVA